MAISVVPPPISTTMVPTASCTGRPAPMAAAMGSSTSRTSLAPADNALSRIARRSTSVDLQGTQTRTRGLGRMNEFSCTLLMKYLSIFSVTRKSAITPSFRGRMAVMLPGVRPSMRFGIEADGGHGLLVALNPNRHHGGLVQNDPLIADVDERVRRPEVYGKVPGKQPANIFKHLSLTTVWGRKDQRSS